ncbi:hypothetical protein L7F22_009483, partial [Adiantum nelumboides]|nr:hypothetical protein [Adiantum nelumboides]
SRVAWDEANLNFLEANKTPKRKITEPKTPYHPPEGTLNNAEHVQAIWNALNEVATSSSGQGESWVSEGEDDDLAESSNRDSESMGLGQIGRRLSFTELRKAHYDEFRKSKSLRQEDLAVNDVEEGVAIDGNDPGGNHAQEMVIDGIGSVGIHDPASPSGSWQRNIYKQPKCS